ncbi:hypothetical protein TBLA_0B07140 [Henningerozyma blattae CBS 6284]|uniref:Mitochondrial glycine transporter n=1 Tax=Henningerozyma blattae (strain ATCC 34711 / CBS 6284 / DSM 70876 / NBRC 10599 / NRRL Y-10934 / UCD 77-7) TaxID=1071380 RepID=I2GZH9_HENB6|nr:hypothetical protein TBLA_0B07140 [Tetrapisispora blattae CBS 6284]CCH59531.1 hypothetical protein TBLA_0B07140 [Tetrapisispora blattae CBS 6284]
MGEKPATRASSHFIGGFCGGLVSAVSLQPFDLVKTRLQQDSSGGLIKVVKALGHPKELWRGTIPSALRTSIGSALYLSCLNSIRTSLANKNHEVGVNKSSRLPQLSMSENLFTGAISRGVVGYVTMPITVIKVRYESTMFNYNSLGDAIKHITKTEGLRGFFKGYGATCLRDTPYSGLYVLLYEKSKQMLPIVMPTKFVSYDQTGNFTTSTSTLINAISATTSASLATTITAPFDTVKTRMQLEPSKFKNFYKTLFFITWNEKFINLFSGLSMRLTRKSLSAGIAWGIYEELIKKIM